MRNTNGHVKGCRQVLKNRLCYIGTHKMIARCSQKMEKFEFWWSKTATVTVRGHLISSWFVSRYLFKIFIQEQYLYSVVPIFYMEQKYIPVYYYTVWHCSKLPWYSRHYCSSINDNCMRSGVSQTSWGFENWAICAYYITLSMIHNI